MSQCMEDDIGDLNNYIKTMKFSYTNVICFCLLSFTAHLDLSG